MVIFFLYKSLQEGMSINKSSLVYKKKSILGSELCEFLYNLIRLDPSFLLSIPTECPN